MSQTARISWIILAGAIAFADSLRGGFVLDDKPIIVENPMIRRLSFAPRLLTENYWNGGNSPGDIPRGGLYRPIPLLSYAFNYQAAGLRPWTYHAVNVLLHLLVSALLYLLVLKLGACGAAAFACALVFAVLPIHAEAVSSIVGRAELLSALFVVAAWLLAFGTESKLKLLAALFCFGLALLSKESSAAFPLALALSEGAPRKRWPVWALFAMAVALYLYWRLVILGHFFVTGGGLYFSGTPPLSVLLTMAGFFMRHYLLPMAAGIGFCADFSRPQISDMSPSQPLGWLCLITVVLMAGGAFAALWRSRSLKGLAVSIFFVLIFPVSNILFKIDLIGAERFLYLPSIGFCMFLGLWWDSLPARALPLGLAVLAWWTGAAIHRGRVWKTEESLWTATVLAAPNSPRAWNGLGAVRAGPQARRAFSRALELDPGLPDAMYNLGKSFFDDGDYESARRWVLEAARRTPEDKDAACLLGMIADKQGDSQKAIGYFQEALRLNPYYAVARRDLGLLLYRDGRTAQAREQLRLYLEYAPQGENTDDVKRFLNKIELTP